MHYLGFSHLYIVSMEGIQENILTLRLINSVHCQLRLFILSKQLFKIVILTVACMESSGVMVIITDTGRNANVFCILWKLMLMIVIEQSTCTKFEYMYFKWLVYGGGFILSLCSA